MDKQRIFDVTVAFLAGQRRQSVNGAECAYRGGDGARCAVGLWIHDAKYDPRMEGTTLSSLAHFSETSVKIAEALPFELTQETRQLLIDLQRAHDRSYIYNPRGWTNLMTIAGEHGLGTTVLNAVWTGKRISE